MRSRKSQPISTRLPAVAIEYDCRGQRVTKTFTDAFAARRFFIAKEKAGKNPCVKKCESEVQ